MNVNGLAADWRHAVAVYRSTPVASAIAIGALAVAMATVSAFLSMWTDLSLKSPQGFEDSRLVTIGQAGGYSVAASSSTPLTLDIVEEINQTIGSLEIAAGVATFPQSLIRDNAPVPVQAEAVTRHFSDLRPRLLLGRRFSEADHRPEAEPVVILSHRLWRDEFGGNPDILNRTTRIADVASASPAAIRRDDPSNPPAAQDYRIVGVMSPGMTGSFGDSTDIWLPYEQAVQFLYGDDEAEPQLDLGLSGSITVTGSGNVPTRMRGLAIPVDGASARAVSDELNARLRIEGQAFLGGLNLTGEEIEFDVLEGVVADIGIQRESRRQVRLFLAGTLLLVIVAACNVSLFLLARASRRQRELGIRMSVGASLRRLARQLASEAGLLILVATVLGVFLSLWVSVALRALPFLQQAEWRDVSPFDWRVLGMLCALMLLLTSVVSLAPILGLRRMGIRASSGTVMARAGWGQRLAGTVQIALTGIMGAVALAFAWHLIFYATADRGFDPEDVLVVELQPGPGFMTETPTATNLAIERDRHHEAITALPGVQDASFASYVPGGAGTLSYTVVQREPGRYVEVGTLWIDEHYFDVLEIPIIHGENVIPNDGLRIVSNETYALETFGRVDAVGEVTRTNRTLVGVVPDVAYGHPAEAAKAFGYIGATQLSYPVLLVKTVLNPGEMRRLLQQKIDAGELELLLGEITRLETLAGRALSAERARTVLTTSAALLVVVLAALGFYGTQRYLVTAGQREYAIRSAIGAAPLALGRLVLARSLRLALPGLILGSLLALIAVAWLRDGFVVREVSPTIVSVTVVVSILAMVLAASVGPALQARRTAPAALLRED